MRIEYTDPKRVDRFGLGWSRNAMVNGKLFQVSVRPGKRVRLAYSSKYGYHWHATVYHEGRILAQFECRKTTSFKAIVSEALYRDFCLAAFGPADQYNRGISIEGKIFERASAANFRGGAGDALNALNRCYIDKE